jgi:hypothetical protein
VKSPLSKTLTKYGISFGISFLLAFVFVYSRTDFRNPGATALVDWYLILCDAFTIPGLLFLMLGCMMSLSSQGALDGVTYVLKNAVKMLIPGMALKMERYYEYVSYKRANRAKGFGFLYITGLICMGFAMIFMLLFYSLYQN